MFCLVLLSRREHLRVPGCCIPAPIFLPLRTVQQSDKQMGMHQLIPFLRLPSKQQQLQQCLGIPGPIVWPLFSRVQFVRGPALITMLDQILPGHCSPRGASEIAPKLQNATKWGFFQNDPFRLSTIHLQIVDLKCYNTDTNKKQLLIDKTKSNTKFLNTK